MRVEASPRSRKGSYYSEAYERLQRGIKSSSLKAQRHFVRRNAGGEHNKCVLNVVGWD